MNKYLYCKIIADYIVACYHRNCIVANMKYHYQIIDQNGVIANHDSEHYMDAETAFDTIDF